MDMEASTSYSSNHSRFSWPKASSIKQNFSLPSTVIYYITHNPSSPNGYLKVAKSCKYFFEKKPLLIVKRIDGLISCSSEDSKECRKNKQNCCTGINLAKTLAKIWHTHKLNFYNHPNYYALLCKKIYRCDTAAFFINNDENVFSNNKQLFEKFVPLASQFQKFVLSNVVMINRDKTTVKLDEILKSLPKIKQFWYQFDFAASAANVLTMKNLNKLQNLKNLQIFVLHNIPEIFVIQDLFVFIKERKNTIFWFVFCSNISEGYKYQLDDFCDNMIKFEIRNCLINYDGQDIETFEILKKRFVSQKK